MAGPGHSRLKGFATPPALTCSIPRPDIPPNERPNVAHCFRLGEGKSTARNRCARKRRGRRKRGHLKVAATREWLVVELGGGFVDDYCAGFHYPADVVDGDVDVGWGVASGGARGGGRGGG